MRQLYLVILRRADHTPDAFFLDLPALRLEAGEPAQRLATLLDGALANQRPRVAGGLVTGQNEVVLEGLLGELDRVAINGVGAGPIEVVGHFAVYEE